MISGKTAEGVLYAVRRGGSAVAYCALSIRCGTRDEEGFHSGIAHFTEHTIFRGTSRKSASVINGYLDRLGGELNAYTTKEEIVLHATVLKEDLGKAASLLLELATSPTFPEKEIKTERGVVIDEIQSYKDSPADDIYDTFEEKMFAGHPLGRPILGKVRSVGAITSDELKKFTRAHFVPEAMALTVVADMDEAALEKSLKILTAKYFPDHVPGEPIAGAIPKGASMVSPVKFTQTIDKRNHEVNIVIGAPAPSLYEEKDRVTAVLLGNILAGPASNSILNSILREKNGWVYSVENSYTQYADTGIMAICLGCDKTNMEKCRSAVRKEILKLQTIPLSEHKLAAAKKQLLGQLAISSDNGESQALAMGKSLLSYGRVTPDDKVRETIMAITSQQLRDMALRIFSPDATSELIFL